MKCVALLSGGKDSVAAIEVAQQHGWEVTVCLRIEPAEDDAWMFHTPNLDVVDAVAQCLGIPLVTAAARADPEQEVDDLQTAIADVKQEYGVDAVISGALASDYQRTRIERIGHRIGLKTFAPLWHKDRRTYLHGLLQAGYSVRFSRVAADGLDAPWVGGPLDDKALQRLASLPSRPDVAGEGGEFETLVLDAPHYRQRIVVDDADLETTSSRATWHVQRWHLEPKS